MRSEACRAGAEVHSRPWLRDWSTTSYSFGLTPGAVCCQNFYFGHKCLWHASCFLHRYYPQSYFYKSHAEINTIMELLEGQIIEGSPGGTTPVIWGDKAWEESNLSWRFILMSYGNENWHGRSDVWYDFSKIHIFISWSLSVWKSRVKNARVFKINILKEMLHPPVSRDERGLIRMCKQR